MAESSYIRGNLVEHRRQRSAEQISAVMARVRDRDTSPELALRKALWRRGVRYRLHRADLPGKPDLVFPHQRVAVFVDGDFWHGNQWRRRGLKSLEDQFRGSPSAAYWIPKIKKNVERDKLNTERLRVAGWRVLRIWESEIRGDQDECVDRVVSILQSEENDR